MRKSSLEGIRQSIGCPCFEFAEDSFDLRPEFLNRVQIRAVRWQVKTVYAGFIQKFFDCLCMVRFHVIHDQNRSFAQIWNQIVFKIILKTGNGSSTGKCGIVVDSVCLN